MLHAMVMAKKRAEELGINKVLIFTGDGEGPQKAVETELFDDMPDLELIAVTFPYNQTYYEQISPDEEVEIVTGIPDSNVRKQLEDAGVRIVQGTMPFQDIIIPDVKDTKLMTIKRTLELFGGGLTLCVEAVIMACDAGAVKQGEVVIALAADTAIVARASRKSLIFSPFEGMEIKEIICKPRNLTINRDYYKKEEEYPVELEKESSEKYEESTSDDDTDNEDYGANHP